MKYRFLQKQKKLSIGVYPIITLAEARNQRDEAKRLLTNNLDPAAVKQEIKQDMHSEAANTFEVIAREWFDMKKVAWSEANTVQTLTGLFSHSLLSLFLIFGYQVSYKTLYF